MSWLRLLLLCALLSASSTFAESTENNATEPTPSPAAKADAAAKAEKDQQDAAIANLPLNTLYHGVHIPHMSPSGKLLMLFDATDAKRINGRNIEMHGLKIEIHNNDGSTFHVEMAHSVYDLDTRIMTSDTPTTIKRDDFVINGDRAEFYTKEKLGKVYGNVKMIINSGDADTSDSTDNPEHPKKGKKNKAAKNHSPGAATPAGAATSSTAATPSDDKDKPADTHK